MQSGDFYRTKLAKCFMTLVACSAIAGCTSTPTEPAVPTPTPTTTVPVTPPVVTTKLMERVIVVPPAKEFKNHPAVSTATVQAAKKAIENLPEPLRKKLDESQCRVVISPNMIDRWPNSAKDCLTDPAAQSLSEQPGRIYEPQEICLYERPKNKGSNDLGPARKPEYLQLHVGDMCFQVLDDMMTLSKDPALRKEWQADIENIPVSMHSKVANFIKTDDWGPRETCAEMFGSMMGGRNENTDNLYKYFPRVKKWLIARLDVHDAPTAKTK